MNLHDTAKPMVPEFSRIKRLPPYVFNITNELKMAARRAGEDIIDLSMGNPDGPTPRHIVDKLVEVAQRQDTHGYSVSKGIPRLRRAISNWYKRRWNVDIDMDREAIVTIGSKEGLAHLMLATLDRGDTVLVPNPSYPIHIYGAVIAGADIRSVRMTPGVDFFEEAERAIRELFPKPKMMIIGFPSNPTAKCVDMPTSPTTAGRRPRSCRCRAPRTWRWSSSPCRRATTWPAGASASWSATRSS
jgi:alanine-synthesizing transaminase